MLLADGASAPKSGIETLGARLLDAIRPLIAIPDLAVAVVDPDAPAPGDGLAGGGRTLIVPFMIGVKFTPPMSLEATFEHCKYAGSRHRRTRVQRGQHVGDPVAGCPQRTGPLAPIAVLAAAAVVAATL